MDRKSAVLVGMGFELVGFIIAAIFIGGFLDERYQLKSMGTLAAIVIAFIGWMTHLVMAVRALDQSEESGDTKPK